MRILYITPDITNSGGIARVIALKANYFSSVLNHEVHIVTPKSPGTTFFYDFDAKINWHLIAYTGGSLKFFGNYIHLIKKTISETKPDVIIICDALYWSFIPWMIETKTPMIFETHVSTSLRLINYKGIIGELRSKLIQTVKNYTQGKFAKVVFITQECSKEWNLPNSIIIPNPLSFLPEKQSELHNKRAIAVCRHSYEKGIDRLLEIWKKVIECHPDWILDVYGQWDDDLHYQKMAMELQISNKVNFIAPTLEIQNHYLEASLCLMASRSESFGMVLIEAMACGLPCVAYDCPSGPRTIIQDGINGFLIEDANAHSFIEKTNLLLGDRDLRIKLGENAKAGVGKYNIDKVMNQWNDLLESIKA